MEPSIGVRDWDMETFGTGTGDGVLGVRDRGMEPSISGRDTGMETLGTGRGGWINPLLLGTGT